MKPDRRQNDSDFRGLQLAAGGLQRHLEPPVASWGLLKPPGAPWGVLGPPRVSLGLLGPPEASWGLPGSPGPNAFFTPQKLGKNLIKEKLKIED